MPHGVAKKKKKNAEKKTLTENYMLINKILLLCLPQKGKNRYIWDLREKMVVRKEKKIKL